MAAAGVVVQVMRVDVEGDKTDGCKGRGVDDWHVVGGADADGSYVGTSAGAHVRNAILKQRGSA